MAIHVVMFITAIIANTKTRLNKKTALQICMIILFFLSALRYSVGNDYDRYQELFDYVNKGNFNAFGTQYLYTLLNIIFPNYYMLVAFVAAVYLIASYKLIVNYLDEDYWGVSMIIFLINPYIFLMSLSAFRQTLAIVVFLGAVQFARQRRIIPYVLLILMATLLHTTAIILLPVYFLANDKKVSKSFVVVFIGLMLFLLVDNSIFSYIMESILGFFNNKNYDYFYNNGEGLTNSVRATILTSIMFAYVALNLHKLEGKAVMCGKFTLFALAFGILASKVAFLTRIQYYFDIFSIITIPSIIKANREMVHPVKIEKLFNVYILPITVFIIYILRYFSFFTNPLWERFTNYTTLLELIK